jgi:hypothetical protein
LPFVGIQLYSDEENSCDFIHLSFFLYFLYFLLIFG